VTVFVNRSDGSYVYASMGVDIDNTPPTLVVHWEPVVNVTGDLVVKATVRDVHMEGAQVSLVVDSGQGRVFAVPATDHMGEFELVLDTLVLENRTHPMYVTAVDQAGNLNTSEVREFNVRNLPDLTINWLDRFDDVVVRRTYVLNFNIRNRGTVAADGFALGFFNDDTLIDTVVHNETVEPGETVRVTMEWTPQVVDSSRLWRAHVDHENVVDELSEVNNEASQGIRVMSSEPSGGCFGGIISVSILLPAIAINTGRTRRRRVGR
jgi:hypothetical protein